MWEKIKKFSTNVFLGLVLIVLLTIVLTAMSYTSNQSTKLSEKVYVQGQYDALYGQVNLTRIVKSGENVNAYAQGFDDAYDGKVIIKSVSDSTFVFTASPWKKGGTVPNDTIKVEL